MNYWWDKAERKVHSVFHHAAAAVIKTETWIEADVKVAEPAVVGTAVHAEAAVAGTVLHAETAVAGAEKSAVAELAARV